MPLQMQQRTADWKLVFVTHSFCSRIGKGWRCVFLRTRRYVFNWIVHVPDQDPGSLRQSSEILKCTPQNHENVEIQDPRDKNEEVTNTPDSTKGNRNIQSTTMKSDCPEKGSISRFHDQIMGGLLER